MGADLVLVSRTERRLEKMAEVVRSHGRGHSSYRPTSPTRTPAPRLVEAALEEFGRVDCLINNAFGIPPMDPLTTLDLEALRDANETNVFAPLRLSALFADALAESRGSVIMLNSVRRLQLAARVLRLQAVQGRAGAPRVVAGDRARAARDPGQQRRAVVHLRGRQQGLLRLAGLGAGRHPRGHLPGEGRAHRPEAAGDAGRGGAGGAVPRLRPGQRRHRDRAQRRLRRVPRQLTMTQSERRRRLVRRHRRRRGADDQPRRLRRHRPRGGAADAGRRPGVTRGRADPARQRLPPARGEERAGRPTAHPAAVHRAPRARRRTRSSGRSSWSASPAPAPPRCTGCCTPTRVTRGSSCGSRSTPSRGRRARPGSRTRSSPRCRRRSPSTTSRTPSSWGSTTWMPTSVEECWRLLRQTGKSISYESLANVPRYSAWLAEQDWTDAYERHQANLQLIGLNDPEKRWVLKNPSHLVALDALMSGLPGRARRVHAPRPGRLDRLGLLALGRGNGRHVDDVRRRDDRPDPAGDAVPVLADVHRGPRDVRPGAVRRRRLRRVRPGPGRHHPRDLRRRSASTGRRRSTPPSPRSTASHAAAASDRSTPTTSPTTA